MAVGGRALDQVTILRLRRLCSVCRMSIRKAAQECGVDAKTAQKYTKAERAVTSRR